MIKKTFAIFLSLLIFPCNVIISADVIDPNENTEQVVTEYYSSDIYSDIIETATIPVSSPPEITSTSAVLMEVTTGKIMFEKDADKKVYPASITKIMTLLLVIEAIESGKLSFYDKITTSEHAASMGGSQIWLEVGETMTVHDLIKAVAVGSANDASVALAEHISGSEEGFVSLMNSKAKAIGMKSTNFENACGLDSDNHYTSARDVAIMSKELIKHDVIKQYSTIWMDTLRNETVQLVNTNKLVRFYRGATGLKTGTTSKAGCCLSATAKRNGMELVSIVMGAESSNERFAFAKRLLDYGFANWSVYSPKSEIKLSDKLNVEKGQNDFVKIKSELINNELLSTDDKNNAKVEVEYNDEISAPIKKGQQLGTVKILIDKKIIKKYKIISKHSVDKINFSFSFFKMLKSFSAL